VELVDDKAIARGMIRVAPGEDLVESLKVVAHAAGWEEAFVTAAGVLELVEIQRGGRTVTLENAEVTSLAGRVARSGGEVEVALRAVLTVGDELISGRVEAAMAGDLVMVVDAILARASVSAPVRPAPVERPPAERASASALTPPSQQFRARPIARPVSAPDPADEEDEENPMVDVGDVLVHPQLGRCEVVGHDAGGGTQVRLSSGKVRVLRLDALHVLAGEEAEEGHMTFKVAGPRRRRSRF
jgi:predicted DNA-binding protein with PD1-like motif